MTKDSIQVLVANGGAVGVSFVENINPWLTAISLALAIIYTLWKFYKNMNE